MSKFCYLELRFILIIITAIAIIVFDGKLNIFFQIKRYVLSSVDFLYYLYDKPCFMFDIASKIIKGYKEIIIENYKLQRELLLRKGELLLLEQCQQENFRLRELINTPLSFNKKKVVSRVIFVNTDPWNHQVIVNMGKNNEVYVGQPVITDKGVVGQVISVSTFSSRVLLIYDINHALSVQVKRNNHRMILIGSGRNDMKLYAECSINIDVRIGDMLITSGLDGCFPEGYPVAIVSNVIINKVQDILIIKAYPIVTFQNLHDVLLIWK